MAKVVKKVKEDGSLVKAVRAGDMDKCVRILESDSVDIGTAKEDEEEGRLFSSRRPFV